MATTTNDNLNKTDNYTAFDALSLKQHIIDRLNESQVFTDQNYSGSNISATIDIISYTFNVLMFYLNKTSSESMFSTAQIYENMNRIVKAIDYKPIGIQTSTLSFKATASATFPPDLYTIPRYSYIDAGGIPFSFNEDITFAKTLSNDSEELTELSKQKLLFQGIYNEHPIYTAVGLENELMYLIVDSGVNVDYFNIDLYVKPTNGTWEQFERTPSLYLENAFASKYEIRLNENGRYEITFGNDINGKKLNEGDQVAIYYLNSLGQSGEVGVNALFGHRCTRLNNTNFEKILQDLTVNQYSLLSNEQLQNISFNNTTISTYFSNAESVEDIRKNAPGTFRSQYRLVTANDYEIFIKTNFRNLIKDIRVVNNWDYLTIHSKYFFDLGITKPNRESRALFNQVNFADSCNFNNVYVVCVPRIVAESTFYSFLTPSQKELIISSIKAEKVLTSEIILIDPVYTAVSIGIPLGTVPTTSDPDNTNILIIKDSTTRRDDASIKADVQNVFLNYFNDSSLGQVIDVNLLVVNILAINGVKTFFTSRTDTTIKYEGLSLMIWNPIFKDIDILATTKNTTLPYFKFPYFNDANVLSKKIQIVGEQSFENVDY